MLANTALILARKHIGNGAAMDTSARICLADAISLYDRGLYEDAKKRAADSLSYSVGIFHADYKRVAKD